MIKLSASFALERRVEVIKRALKFMVAWFRALRALLHLSGVIIGPTVDGFFHQRVDFPDRGRSGPISGKRL